MKAHEVDLITLVQGAKQFQVPLYQRPYSWGIPQLEQIWDDIVAEAERQHVDDPGSGHFIGSVVLAPSPAIHAGGLHQWLVVDGQQRLTTLLLALAAIRDHVRSADGNSADRIEEEYLVNKWKKGDERLRLLPTQADRDTFRACILGLPGADTGDGVGAAYRWFRAALVQFDDPDDPNDVARLEVTIRERLRLVEITAEHGDNVHRIFESLNNTGLKLSQADLLRNHLFMLLPHRGEDVYRDLWLPMQERLDRNLELLMWLDLLLGGDDKAKQGDIYRAHVELLRRIENDEARIEERIARWHGLASHLATILDPTLESNSEVRTALRRLADWGGQIAYPTAMLLLVHRDRGLLTSTQVAHGLTLVESFLVRRMIAGVPTNNLNRILNAVPRELTGAEDTVDALHEYLSGQRRYWPSDGQIKTAVRARPFYWTGRGPQRTFVLRRLEESLESAEPIDWAKAKVTIEHVLPQTMTHEWESELADAAQADGISVAELHGSLVHTLGNLTLTGVNQKLSNHPFQRKQDLLAGSALLMNQQIAATDHWGRDEILGRADRLAEAVAKIWPAPLDGHHEEARNWTQLHRILALMPAGTWTTYGDLAEVVGSHAVPVGFHIAKHNDIANAWRVLTADGSSSSQFRWSDPQRTETQQQVLEAEGVPFDGSQRALPSHRLAAADLARMLGLDTSDDAPAVELEVTDLDLFSQFAQQLEDTQPAAVVDGLESVFDGWTRLGGYLGFGNAAQTTCFLLLHPGGGKPIWPFAIYPQTGSVEVVFQHMARRPPFDDPALRRELMDQLNAVQGIDLLEAKLLLRPSFPLSVFADELACTQILATAEWFAVAVHSHAVQQAEIAESEGAV